MALTVAEASAVNDLLNFLLGDPTSDQWEHRARTATKLLADHAAKTLKAGLDGGRALALWDTGCTHSRAGGPTIIAPRPADSVVGRRVRYLEDDDGTGPLGIVVRAAGDDHDWLYVDWLDDDGTVTSRSRRLAVDELRPADR